MCELARYDEASLSTQSGLEAKLLSQQCRVPPRQVSQQHQESYIVLRFFLVLLENQLFSEVLYVGRWRRFPGQYLRTRPLNQHVQVDTPPENIWPSLLTISGQPTHYTQHLGRPRAVTHTGGRVSIGIYFFFSIFHFTTLRVIRAFLLQRSRPKNIGVVGQRSVSNLSSQASG